MERLKNTFHLVFLRTVFNTVSAALLLFACIALVLHRDAARNGVFTGVYMCLNMLIPSLFPFVLLSCLISKSKAAALLFRPISPIMHYVFRLPPCAAPALLLGLTAGYPVGAKITASLYEKGELDKEQAARLLCFCTAPGYAFCSYTAAQLSVSAHSARLLFLSSVLPPLFIGIVRARFAPKPKARNTSGSAHFDLTDAVRDGVSAMTMLCGFIVVFSALLSVLQASGIFRAAVSLFSALGITVPYAGALFTYFLEVTAGVKHCAYWHLPLTVTAFGLAFSGLCIQLQLFSFFHTKPFPLLKPIYLTVRFATALCTSGVCRLLLRLFPDSTPVAASNQPLTAVPAGSPALSAALLCLSVFFLLVCTNTRTPQKNN